MIFIALVFLWGMIITATVSLFRGDWLALLISLVGTLIAVWVMWKEISGEGEAVY